MFLRVQGHNGGDMTFGERALAECKPFFDRLFPGWKVAERSEEGERMWSLRISWDRGSS